VDRTRSNTLESQQEGFGLDIKKKIIIVRKVNHLRRTLTSPGEAVGSPLSGDFKNKSCRYLSGTFNVLPFTWTN